MPNHVKNVLKFRKLNLTDIQIITDMIATEIPRADKIDYAIDFNKIIPEPETEEECPEDCLVNKDSHVQEEKDKPWFDWYTWRNKYWGTKWGAYDCYSKIGKSYITFVFSTAWSMPYPIIEQLHVLGYEFELRYADEDLGSNCGILSYEPNGITGEMEFYHDDESALKNPEQFARRLWNNY